MKHRFNVLIAWLLFFGFPVFGHLTAATGSLCPGEACLAPLHQDIPVISDKQGRTYVLKKTTGTVHGKEQVFLFAEQSAPVPSVQHDEDDDILEWYYADDLEQNPLFKEAFQKGFTGKTAGYISYIIHPDRHFWFMTYEITHIDVHYLFRKQGLFTAFLLKMSETWPPGTRLIINNIEQEETYDALISREKKSLVEAFRGTPFNTVLERCGFKVERIHEGYSKLSGDIYDVHAVFRPGELPRPKFPFSFPSLGSLLQKLRIPGSSA